uniref:Uncharacterized protein n=1 Tax=Candidatus Kentrum sp. DK TaxID=2126562 RepID=A0A450SRW2_9GAMM|nr:MAG: hypothetical protein BECKDK2373B_GA0170837_106010 [Candidatus Kentron sp. DK]
MYDCDSDSKLIGLCLGLFFIALLSVYTFMRYGKNIEFKDVVTIMFLCVSIVVGGRLGYLTMATTNESDLGIFLEYKEYIVGGTLAIVWVAFDSLVNTCRQAIKQIEKSISQKKPPD